MLTKRPVAHGAPRTLCRSRTKVINVKALALVVAAGAAATVGPAGSASAGAREDEGRLRPAPRAEPAEGRSLSDTFRSEVGDRVFFAEGRADLGRRANVAIQAQALWLLEHGQCALVIEGHSDDPGGEQVNVGLAAQRAERVRRRLLELGVAGHRLTVAAYGRTRPAAVCAQARCAAHNRRVVLRITELPAPQAATPRAQPEAGTGVRAALRRLF